MSRFDERFDHFRSHVEARLPDYFPPMEENAGGRVVTAARYSLTAGGKRLRPVLLLATAEMLGGLAEAMMPFAVAVKMIHTYSLIHDDLPCMDDDDLRRGRPTCHVAFGEAIAVLAGDALLNRAFEIVHETGPDFGEAGWTAAGILSYASGSRGMIGGQALDLLAEETVVDHEGLIEIHRRKTGALIKAPILMAAALSGATDEVTLILERYADAIGLAFQIRDDMLDVVSEAAVLGKSTGKDVRDHKSTYVTLFGLEGAQRHLEIAIERARVAVIELTVAGYPSEFFAGLAEYLILRNT